MALGPKFALSVSPRDVDIFKLISEVESIFSMIPDQLKNIIRSRATNYITNFIHYNTDTSSPVLQVGKTTRQFLKDNPELIVTRSVKGNLTVIMNKGDYIQKSLELLNDDSTYKALNNNKKKRLIIWKLAVTIL